MTKNKVVELHPLEQLSNVELAEYYTLAEDNAESAIVAMRGMITELQRRNTPPDPGPSAS